MDVLYDPLRHQVDKHCFDFLYRTDRGDTICLQCFRWLLTSPSLLSAKSAGTRQLTELLATDRSGLSRTIVQQNGPYLAQTIVSALSSHVDEDLVADILSLSQLFCNAAPHHLPLLLQDRILHSLESLAVGQLGEASLMSIRGLLGLLDGALLWGMDESNRYHVLTTDSAMNCFCHILFNCEDCSTVCHVISVIQHAWPPPGLLPIEVQVHLLSSICETAPDQVTVGEDSQLAKSIMEFLVVATTSSAGGQHIAALVKSLDAANENSPSNQVEVVESGQDRRSAAAAMFTMIKACLVCQDSRLQSTAGHLLFLFGSSCLEVCDRLLDFDICEYTCEGLRVCCSSGDNAFTSLRPFALNALELLHVMAASPGSSFAAHFKYGYDTVCKLMEAATAQADPSLQNGCLRVLITALGTSGVSPTTHAALKKTITIAAEALPELEHVTSRDCAQPSSETLECWRAACALLQHLCNYISGDMPDTIYKLLDSAVQRACQGLKRLDGDELQRYFPSVLSAVHHISIVIWSAPHCSSQPTEVAQTGELQRSCLHSGVLEAVEANVHEAYKRVQDYLNGEQHYTMCQILSLALRGPAGECTCSLASAALSTRLLQGGILKGTLSLLQTFHAEVATDCWNLLRDIMMREGSLPVVSATYIDIPFLARHLVSLDSILDTLAGTNSNLGAGNDNEQCLLIILTMLHLGQRYDPLISPDMLNAVLQAFILGNKQLLRDPAILVMTFRLFTASASLEQPFALEGNKRPAQAEQILWSALDTLQGDTALEMTPTEHGTGVLLQHIEHTQRVTGRLLLMWLQEGSATDLAGQLASHPPSLDALLFLASREDWSTVVRSQFFELARHLAVGYKLMVHASTLQSIVMNLRREVLGSSSAGMPRGTSSCLHQMLHTLPNLVVNMVGEHIAQFGPELIQQACQLVDRLADSPLFREDGLLDAVVILANAVLEQGQTHGVCLIDMCGIICRCTALVSHIDTTIIGVVGDLGRGVRSEFQASAQPGKHVQLLQLSTNLQTHAPGMYRSTIGPRGVLMLARHAQGCSRSAALKWLQARLTLESTLASGRVGADIFEKPQAHAETSMGGALWSLLPDDIRSQTDLQLQQTRNEGAVTYRPCPLTTSSSIGTTGETDNLCACLFLLQNFAADDHPDVRAASLQCMATLVRCNKLAHDYIVSSPWSSQSLLESCRQLGL